MAVCAAACVALWPHARDAAAILAAQDDPAVLSDLQLNSALRNNPAVLAENIEAALAAGDVDLADSFVGLARDKNISLPDDLSRRVSDAVTEQNSSSHFAKRFAVGLVTGNADDVASLSGTVAGDLFVFGDIRDIMREGKHLAMGEETDQLMLGLAAVGLVVTAATYVSVGGVAPLRAGLTLVKDARKVGRLGEGLTQWAGRSAREVVERADAAACGRLRIGAAAGPDHDRDQGGVSRREGRRAGSPRQGHRAGRREGRHPRRAGHPENRRRPEGRRPRRAAGGIQGRPNPRDPQGAGPRRACCWRPARSI